MISFQSILTVLQHTPGKYIISNDMNQKNKTKF